MVFCTICLFVCLFQRRCRLLHDLINCTARCELIQKVPQGEFLICFLEKEKKLQVQQKTKVISLEIENTRFYKRTTLPVTNASTTCFSISGRAKVTWWCSCSCQFGTASFSCVCRGADV